MDFLFLEKEKQKREKNFFWNKKGPIGINIII